MTTNDISIVILAAGKGSRMKSSLPKVLHKLSGKPMIYYSIKEAQRISDDITIVLYHQATYVKEQIETYFSNINFVLQDHDNYPGTGGALMNIDFEAKRVLVLNGDMPLIEASELQKLIIENVKLSMSVFNMQDASGYGRVKIENNKVEKIIEQKDCNEEELKINYANAGIYCFDGEFLSSNLKKLSNDNAQQEYYVTDLVEFAVKQNIEVAPVFVNEENFKGVNSKLDLELAEQIHQTRIKNNFMKNGVIMHNANSIFIEEGVSIVGECELENGVTLRGSTKLENSKVLSHSVVEDANIVNSSVGPFARIRPQSDIKDSKIGNFVEVKKSSLNSVKAGHLSYLGDSEIGEGTNIGAGTITCNYDGKNKYKTIIGKNVFIGSDVKIIAPVEIEDNVIVAAGSVVNKDVPKGY